MIDVYMTTCKGQGDTSIHVYEVGKHDDWIAYIFNHGPVTDFMINEYLNHSYRDITEDYNWCKEHLQYGFNSEMDGAGVNDRALIASSGYSYFSSTEFAKAYKQNDWNIIDEFEGYIY